MPNPLGSTLVRVQVTLVLQAAVSGAFAAGPLSTGSFVPDRWLPLILGSAAGALVLAGFVSTRTRSAWTMTLGFELLALAVGAAGLADSRWFPGSVLAALVLVQLALPSGRAAFPAEPSAQGAPVRLTPPAVVVPPRPAPPSAPPAFPPAGLLVSASVPPPPSFPPPPGFPPPLH